MSEPLLAQGAENELDSLKSAIAAFGASEDEAQVIEPHLRSERRTLAEEFLELSEPQIAGRFAGPLGDRHRLITYCGLRDLERDAQDEALAARTRARFGAAPPAPGVLLAAMLLFHAFELPDQAD